LRKAHSTVSLENPPLTLSHESIPESMQPRTHRRTSSASYNNGAIFDIGSSSDEDYEFSRLYPVRPRLAGHRASSDSISFSGETANYRPRSPVRSRRSSFSSGLTYNSSVPTHRASPKQVYASSAREFSTTVPPSSRHLLSMTPTSTLHPSSPDLSMRKQRR
jgi:TAG lipase/steryl ester hydrolase/phospholipase A2/LPA acyltransferase